MNLLFRRVTEGEIKPAPKLRIGTLDVGAMVRDDDNPVNVAKKMEGAREKAS